MLLGPRPLLGSATGRLVGPGNPQALHADPRPAGTPIPRPGRIGKGPVSRFPIPANRESGIGKSPTKNGKTGDSDPIPDSRVTSEHQLQWTRNILSHGASAVSCQCRSDKQQAAPILGPREGAS